MSPTSHKSSKSSHPTQAAPTWRDRIMLLHKSHSFKRLAILSLLALVLIFGALMWRLYLKNTARLVNYLPNYAGIYLELQPKQDAWSELTLAHPRLAVNLNQWLIDQGLNQAAINNTNKLALVGLVAPTPIGSSQAATLNWAYLAELKQPKEFELDLPAGVFTRRLDDQIAVWSFSEAALSDFGQLRLQHFAPQETTRAVLGQGFIVPRLLTRLIPSNQGLEELLTVATLNKLPTINYIAYLEVDRLVLSTEPKQDLATQAPKLSLWPEVDLLIVTTNLKSGLELIETNLRAHLPQAYIHWQDLTAEFRAAFDTQAGPLAAILDKPAISYIQIPQLNRVRELDMLAPSLLQANFVTRFSSPLTDQLQATLESVLQQLVAHKVPLEVPKTLPDNSTATHLIAAPESLVFSQFNEQPNSSYLNLPEIDQEIIILPETQNAVLSNASPWLNQYLDESRYTQVIACSNAPQAEHIYLSQRLLGLWSKLASLSSAVISLHDESLNICLNF